MTARTLANTAFQALLEANSADEKSLAEFQGVITRLERISAGSYEPPKPGVADPSQFGPNNPAALAAMMGQYQPDPRMRG